MAKRYYQRLGYASPPYEVPDEELLRASADPDCTNQQECLETLAHRRQRREQAAENVRNRTEQEKEHRAQVRAELADNPFDPRNEVSQDAIYIAKRIITHLWIIFVLLPVVLVIVYELLK